MLFPIRSLRSYACIKCTVTIWLGDVRPADRALAEALEKTKRKYQAKLRRLEQQMLQIVERHSGQVSGRPGPVS